MRSCESLHTHPTIPRISLLGNISQCLQTPNILPMASTESRHLSRGSYSGTFLNKKETMLMDVTPPQIIARTYTLCTCVLRIPLTSSLASQILTSLLRSFLASLRGTVFCHFLFFLSLVSPFFFFPSLWICLSALYPYAASHVPITWN